MAFAGNAIANFEAAHFLSHLEDFTDVFVTDMHWHGNRFLRPFIPFPDMDVGPADGGLANSDEYVVVSDFRTLHARERKTGSTFEFGEGFHCVDPDV